jgi:hypothetical protein
MAIASNDYLYTIVNDGKLMRSTDTGRTWIPLDSASTYQASTVFAGRNDVILVGRIGGTSRSTDYGNTWLISNFCSTRIVSLTQNSHGTFFACTDSGKVFQSTDIGTTWSEVSNGLFRGLTHAIACDSTGYLYVGTEGGGVYRTSISTPVDFDKSAEPQQFILFQNYPNPFNGLTNIEIKVKVETKVELNVYDVLGRVIIAIVHDRMSAGNHRFRWNAEKLPSGVYMYRVNIGGISETRRMVLLR